MASGPRPVPQHETQDDKHDADDKRNRAEGPSHDPTSCLRLEDKQSPADDRYDSTQAQDPLVSDLTAQTNCGADDEGAGENRPGGDQVNQRPTRSRWFYTLMLL